MVTVEQANEYLNVVGRLLPPDADDRTWLLVIANAVAGGLVPSVDWDSAQGAILIGLIEEVYNDFTEWLDTEGIDPADFKG
jgi:hypothetical protein